MTLLKWPEVNDAPAEDERDALTLSRLCNDLGVELLEVVLAPSGLDVRVRGVVMHDPLDPLEATAAVDDVVLGVGLTGHGDATLAVIGAGGSVHVAAIVLKRHEELSREVVLAAQDAGIAVLAISSDVSWGDLYGLIQAALSAGAPRTLPRTPGAMSNDLLALADATSAATGGPVLFEDTSGSVLAFSQGGQDVDEPRSLTILRRRVSDEWMDELRQSGIIKRLMDTDGVVPVQMFDAQPRRAITIRAGAQVLGFIWLAGDAGTLSAYADEGLREAAKIAALHLMRKRVFDDLDRRARAGMLRIVLRGDAPPNAVLTRLGLPAQARLQVIAVDVPDSPDTSVVTDRVVSLIVEHLTAYRWRACGTVLDGRVYVVVAHEKKPDHRALCRTFLDCLKRTKRAIGAPLRAGLSHDVATDSEIPWARRLADQCLDLGSREQDIVVFEDVHGRAMLADMEGFMARQPKVMSPILRQLVEADRERGSTYVETLRAYLGAFGDTATAADRLHIHANTLRYRIRRIIELTGVDLTDPDARLALELQLRVLAEDGPANGE